MGRHTETCLRCQAEIAIESRIGRALSTMGGDHLLAAPAGLMTAVMDSLDTSFPATPRRIPRAAIATVGLVGVASVMAWTVTRRAKSST